MAPKLESSREAVVTPAATTIERIRASIVDGTLAPGSKLRQVQLADEYATTRAEIREVLRQLESEGLVISTHHRSARVAQFDRAEFLETYAVRLQIEPYALMKSVPRLSDEDIDRIGELNAAISRSDDLSAWLAADRDFHLATYAAAPVPRLLRFIQELQNATHHYRRAVLLLADDDSRRTLDIEHRLILEAIQRRDAELAQLRMQAHIRQTMSVFERFPEVFENPESFLKKDAPTMRLPHAGLDAESRHTTMSTSEEEDNP